MTRHKLNSLSWQFVKQSDKCFSAVHPYESFIEFQLLYHECTSGLGLRPKPWSWRGKNSGKGQFSENIMVQAFHVYGWQTTFLDVNIYSKSI